jgi:hypothetical protein
LFEVGLQTDCLKSPEDLENYLKTVDVFIAEYCSLPDPKQDIKTYENHFNVAPLKLPLLKDIEAAIPAWKEAKNIIKQG